MPPPFTMDVADFDYTLPEALIAQHPLAVRSHSRLLSLHAANGVFGEHRFADLVQLLQRGDLLVFNDTRVMPARLFATKDSGGRVEVLVERIVSARRALARVRASKPPRAGGRLRLAGGVEAVVARRTGELFELEFASCRPLQTLLARFGRVPLPPYIRRADEPADRERYQTVYARREGAVAAPTAGLHFDRALLARLAEAGIERAFITLHIGSGTFQPLRVDDIRAHRMHPERVEVSAGVCARIAEARRRGRRVVAVGTTCVRALETAASDGVLQPFCGETELFIYPGYAFRCVDALVTNFHLPRSTLLMLVCAFGGRERVLAAYRHAVRAGYRFYSYGDAMFLTPRAPA